MHPCDLTRWMQLLYSTYPNDQFIRCCVGPSFWPSYSCIVHAQCGVIVHLSCPTARRHPYSTAGPIGWHYQPYASRPHGRRQQIPVSQELWRASASQIPDPDAACSLFSGHHSCSSQGSNPSVPVCTSMAMGSRYGMGACYTFSTLIKFVENAYNIYIFK